MATDLEIAECQDPGRPASRKRPDMLGLLLDLEVPLIVCLGSTTMLLGDVARLASGSVVEFGCDHRNAALELNGRVIARGEVVIVNGNYGVKISQVATAASFEYAAPLESKESIGAAKDSRSSGRAARPPE